MKETKTITEVLHLKREAHNMTPLLTKWRELEEEFDKNYLPWSGGGGTVYSLKGNYVFPNGGFAQDVKDFHRQSLIAIIEGEIERLDKLRIDDNGGFSKYDKDQCKWCGAREMEYHKLPCKTAESIFYNMAIDQQISYYQSTLEGVKKL